MSTVGAIIDRLYRTYLYPPDARPATCLLDTTITDSDTSVILGTFSLPEDEELLNVGVVFEIGSELFFTTAYDENTTTATVQRGFMGTTAAAHTAGDPIILSPPYPRQSVLEAVADNILTLYPSLYTVNTKLVGSLGMGVYDIEDDLAVEIVEAWPDGPASMVDVDARVVDYHPTVGGRAVVANIRTGSLWVRYRRRFGSATADSDTWVSIGMDERWANIVMAGTAADLFAGRDVPASHVDWVGAVLQAENIPVGTRSNVSRNLAAYREYLLNQAAKEMRAEYKAKAHMRPAGQVVTRSAWG